MRDLSTMAAPDGAETSDALASRALRRLEQSFQSERIAGLRLATNVGLAACVAIGALLLLISPPPWLYGYEIGVGAFALVILAHYQVQRRLPTKAWVSYLFVALSLIVIALSMILPNLVFGSPWTTQMFLRNNTGIYFFVMIAMVSLSYSPGLTLWAGAVSVICWAAIVLVMGDLWSDTALIEITAEMSLAEMLEVVLDPRYVSLDNHLQDVVVIMVVTTIMATSVARSRRLAWREALAERARGNLARYFPPQIVDRLSQSDEPLANVRAQEVAVLFADIVGFSSLAERQSPEQVIGLLRDFHRRLEQAVFANGGTLDKFLGDGVMATFGTPEPGLQDAVNALAAAQAMHASIERWNEARARSALPAIRLSVGLHFGSVVLGDIGSQRRLEFAVLGDAVNLASRLEGLTRSLDARTVASDELIESARRQAGPEQRPLIEAFRRAAPQEVRGRHDRVAVWVAGVATRPEPTRDA